MRVLGAVVQAGGVVLAVSFRVCVRLGAGIAGGTGLELHGTPVDRLDCVPAAQS
jgi:hypothetical protein